MKFSLDFLNKELSFKWFKDNKIFIITSAVVLIAIISFSFFIFTPSSGYFLSALIGAPSTSSSLILVKFKNDPNIQASSMVSQIAGGPKVNTAFNSINSLNRKYKTQSSRKMFAQVQGLPNTYELTVSASNIGSTVQDFKKDSNVEYARVSEPGLEQKIENEVNTINQNIVNQHLSWTAGYTLPEIMTDQDRMNLVGSILSADESRAISEKDSQAIKSNQPTAGGCGLGVGSNFASNALAGAACPSGQELNPYTGDCCTPDCSGKTCGDDGCCAGITCGNCAENQVCDGTNNCCTPDCSGKACGASDGCGGTCQNAACPSGQVCQYNGCSGLLSVMEKLVGGMDVADHAVCVRQIKFAVVQAIVVRQIVPEKLVDLTGAAESADSVLLEHFALQPDNALYNVLRCL